MIQTILAWIGAHVAGLAVDAVTLFGARCLHCGARRNAREHVDVDRWSLELCYPGFPKVDVLKRSVRLCRECATVWLVSMQAIVDESDFTIRLSGTIRPPTGFVGFRLAVVQVARGEIPHLMVLRDVSVAPTRSNEFAGRLARSMDAPSEAVS